MNHAYTVIGVAEYNGEQLIKMRNPWGVEKYTGPWSDKDTSKWTEAARKALGHTNANDGSFYVPADLYSQLFHGIASVNFRNDWKRAVRDDAAWDRNSDRNTLKHTFSNPTAQQVAISL